MPLWHDGFARMLTGPLRQNKNAGDDEYRDDQGSDGTTQSKAAVVHRLIEEIADSGAERPG